MAYWSGRHLVVKLSKTAKQGATEKCKLLGYTSDTGIIVSNFILFYIEGA